MKKIHIAVAALLAASSAFADFSQAELKSDSANGDYWYVQGTGSASDLAAIIQDGETGGKVGALKYGAGNLNFDDDTVLTISGESVMYGTSKYGVGVVKDQNAGFVFSENTKGTLIVKNTNGMISGEGKLAVNIKKGEAGVGGIITTKIAAHQNSVWLGLERKNAIRNADGGAFIATVNKAFTISMSASQHIRLDVRKYNPDKFSFTVTDGAYLCIDGSQFYGDATSASDVTIKSGNALEDGAILFLKEAFTVEDDGSIVKRSQTFKIVDNSGKTLDLVKSEITYDGKNYYAFSATAIPEPAEWAAIFGAAALALAVCRRRK